MVITVQSVSSINAASGVVVSGDGDQYWLLAGVNLVTTQFIGVSIAAVNVVVTIDGTIQSFTPAVATGQTSANTQVVIGSTGVARSTVGTGAAIYLDGSGGRLANAGLVEGVGNIGVYFGQSGGSVVNTGEIRAGKTGVYFDRSISPPVVSLLENHGMITGGRANNAADALSAGVAVDTWAVILNYGTIASASSLEGTGAGIYFTSSAHFIAQSVFSITNHGTISSARSWAIDASAVLTGDGRGLDIVNSGLITGYLGSIYASGLSDTVKNAGELFGTVWFGAGYDQMTNTGRVMGDVFLGLDNDIFIGRDGTVTGLVQGEAGDDLLIGGSGADNMTGQIDNDTLRGLDGDDTLVGDSGTDVVEGGRGDDSLTGGTGGDALQGGAGSDTISGEDDNDLIHGGADDDLLSGGNGLDTVFGEAGDDSLTGGALADWLTGGKGEDSLDGGSENDLLDGGAGADTLVGGAGADVLVGGQGGDVLRAGFGRDTLAGGADGDVFVFATTAECGVGASRDLVTDFQTGLDKLDLSSIKAGMVFIGGGGFTNVAGQLRFEVMTGLLSGDVNGDSVADFNLQFTVGTLLAAGDFTL